VYFNVKLVEVNVFIHMQDKIEAVMKALAYTHNVLHVKQNGEKEGNYFNIFFGLTFLFIIFFSTKDILLFLI